MRGTPQKIVFQTSNPPAVNLGAFLENIIGGTRMRHRMSGRFWIRWLVLVAGAAIALLLILKPIPGSAQSLGGLDSRVARLEVENSVLRSRLSQLESQIDRLGSGVPRMPRAPNLPPRAAPGEEALAQDPTFRRLATLVIELRERIGELETQVEALQEKGR